MQDYDSRGTTKQCFSVIQSKKLWSPLTETTCALCPSMDLIVLGMKAANSNGSGTNNTTIASAQTLWIHRTVSWQKLAALTFEKEDGATHVCWSPDGMQIAVAKLRQQVDVHRLECLTSSSGGPNPMGGTATPDYSLDATHGKIIGLGWAHAGRSHPKWDLSQDEAEDEVFLRLQSHYLDKAHDFLPPAGDNSDNEADDNRTKTADPLCTSPLSLLCVATENFLSFYMHGKYKAFEIPYQGRNKVNVLCSNDLSEVLVHEVGSRRLNIYSLPVRDNRFFLQAVSSLHCTIFSHIQSIRECLEEIATSWKSSLKPLDTKLVCLVKLLTNYGVKEAIGQVLRKYILLGQTSASSNIANAMDQFFTSVQMNDQLLQRMERSLQGALANVESLVRKGLLDRSRALVFHISEADGLCYDSCLSFGELYSASESLLIRVESLLTHVLEGRFRLRDLVAWLRSTGSEVKARGTAVQSVQRENARKRRVPQALVDRLLSYFAANQNCTDASSCGVTESLLGLSVTGILRDGKSRPDHTTPSKDDTSRNDIISSERVSIPFSVELVRKTAESVFAEPTKLLSKPIVSTELLLPATDNDVKVAVCTRLGSGKIRQNNDTDGEPTFFFPNVEDVSCSNILGVRTRQWGIIAQSGGENAECIQLFAVPLGGDTNDADVAGGSSQHGSFYLTTKIEFGDDSFSSIKNLGFYGDDGKSSLSSASDSGAGEESRQKLGILVCTTSISNNTEEQRLELWLMPYDTLPWQAITNSPDLVGTDKIIADCSVKVVPEMKHERMDDESDSGLKVIQAQTRILSLSEASTSGGGVDSNCDQHLMLCGSRGMAGITLSLEGSSCMEILDIEDDEDEGEGEDEEELSDNDGDIVTEE